MADLEPFRGWRYDPTNVGALSGVVAPPYDVIDEREQTDLYERHPCNIVRLILNRDEPGDASGDDRYTRAATYLKDWKIDGVLMQDADPCLYVYHQEFEWEGVSFSRRGFLGRVRLEAFGEGQIYPHEQTMSGPKADRLKLLRACRTNLSPIFGLYPDPDQKVQSPLEDAIRDVTPLEVTDDLGVLHRFWPVGDPSVVGQVRSAIAEQPIFIADGHHRYETAVNYRNELRNRGVITGDDHPANFVMMACVGMSDPGLAILPTHRLLSGLPRLTEEQLRSALEPVIEFEPVATGGAEASDGAAATWDRVRQSGDQDVFGFGLPDGGWLFGVVSEPERMTAVASERSETWRSLGVSLLHRLIIEDLLQNAFPESEPTCRYVHKLEEVTSSLQSGNTSLGVLVNPASIEQVETIASGFETMPPKSTYFYPKLLSGLVLNPLE